MKILLGATILSAGFALTGGAAFAADCGNVTIASMNWQSAEVAANLDKIILERVTVAALKSSQATPYRH